MKCKTGYKQKGNKCVKSKSRNTKGFLGIKKKNNPFKMWGSYIGAVIFFIVSFILSYIGCAMTSGCGSSDWGIFLSNIFLENIFRWTTIMIIGFLIGWGINVLWRKRK